MFEKLITLFERLVIAHERLATSQEALLNNCACATTAAPEPQAPPAPETDWNPFTSELMNKYVADKQAILDARLQENGIEVKANATGKEKHQALLDWANAKKDELAEVLAEPEAAPEVVEPEVKDVSHDEMKAAVKDFAVRCGKDKAKALIKEVGKAEKLADITDQALINALYAAATEA